MKKALIIMSLSLFLVPFSFPEKVEAATVYSQSGFVDKQIPIATSTVVGTYGFYIRLPNDTIYYQYTGSIDGSPLTVPSYNRIVLFIQETNLTPTQVASVLFYNGSSQPTGPCTQSSFVYTCPITATTTLEDLSFLPPNVPGGWAVLGGSSLNAGVSITNVSDNYITNGGFAFLLCSTTCDTSFQQRASLDASILLSGVGTTTAAETCQDGIGTTTGILDAVGNSISNGFCRVAVFLFVPSPATIQSFGTLASSTRAKIPFSYYFDVQTVLDA